MDDEIRKGRLQAMGRRRASGRAARAPLAGGRGRSPVEINRRSPNVVVRSWRRCQSAFRGFGAFGTFLGERTR